ncbi:hypothetical protein PIPA1_17420 [Pelosinus sp. IPA-1]|nr:hypothetical protein PIPA1_17420 [Pelosinus sp. IPA-1]
MRVKGKIFSIIVMIIISFSSVFVCSAMDKKDLTDEVVLLVVADESRETYGLQLKNEVYTQLEKQLKIAICKESELQDKITNYSVGEISKAEKPELFTLASKTGVNMVLVVEILPTKSDFSEILFYQSIKSEATIKVRLYDAVKQQYVLTEEIGSTGVNKTIIPYTFVGKKVTVVEAVHKATTIVAERVNQKLANYK